MALAYGPLFPVYVAIIALSLSGTAILLSQVDVATLPARFGPRFPRRAMIAFGLYMAILLGGMWLPLIARTFMEASVPQLYGGTTLVVQAFDLGFLVPVGLFTAVTVYRRLPIGHLLSAVIIVKGASVAAGIVAMLAVEWATTNEPQLLPIAIFALTASPGSRLPRGSIAASRRSHPRRSASLPLRAACRRDVRPCVTADPPETNVRGCLISTDHIPVRQSVMPDRGGSRPE